MSSPARATLPRILSVFLFALMASAAFAQNAPGGPGEFVIKDATVLTASHGRIEHGSIYVKNGKIAAVGQEGQAPASAQVIDVKGAFVTPGIIDPHSHMALDNDVNE